MPRNPVWTDSDAASIRSLIAVDDGPDAPFLFDEPEPNLDGQGITTGGLASANDLADFIAVELQEDAEYTFLSVANRELQDGSFVNVPTVLSIFDQDGYLLLFTDANDLGSEQDNTDTIVQFRAERAGTHYLSISFEDLSIDGSYAVAGEFALDAANPDTGNFPPVAMDDLAVENRYEVVRIDPLPNDMDADADTLQLDMLDGPENGFAAIVDGTVLYRSNRNFTGEDSFFYQISDDNGDIDTGRVFLTVGEQNNVMGVTRSDAQVIAYLYEAGLDRDGDIDEPGLNFWVGRREAGAGLREISNAFLTSNEFAAAFGDPDSLTDRQFIEILYQNVLDRDGEEGGVVFWEGQLAQPGVFRQDVLLAFAESAENLIGSPQIADLVQEPDGDWAFA